MDLYWTSKKSINGLKHFVFINQYELKKEVFFDFVSVLDDEINFTISKRVFEESSQWKKGWDDMEAENIDIKEYKKFKSLVSEYKPNKIFINETSVFNIS